MITSHPPDKTAHSVVVAIRILNKVVEGIGQQVAQATEDGVTIKCIDGMTQDEPDISERRETDGNKLLAEHVVGEVILR